MSLSSTNLISAIRSRTQWLVARQRVISQNIANSDTPRFKARDLKAQNFQSLLRSNHRPPDMSFGKGAGILHTTDSHHYNNGGTLAIMRAQPNLSVFEKRTPFEVSPDENSVNLEEQMVQLNQTTDSHRFMTNLSKKYTEMYRYSIRAPS
ncbi:MAG: flagellar basal body protein [Pseudomonadota bacterium]